MPYKNHFLNLSRTGGVSVYCFRLPLTTRLAHRNRFINPVFEMLAQKNKFLHEHNREAKLPFFSPILAQSHPPLKDYVMGMNASNFQVFYPLFQGLDQAVDTGFVHLVEFSGLLFILQKLMRDIQRGENGQIRSRVDSSGFR